MTGILGMKSNKKGKTYVMLYGKSKANTIKSKQSISKLGKPTFNKGKYLTDEHKKKLSISHKGIIPWNKGKSTGKHSWNYKGENYNSKNKRLRCHPKWRIWREKVFLRDDWTCQKCHIKGGKLEAHHLISVKECINTENIDLIYDENNGITLCRKCHMLVHKWKVKK
ncbi:MAG: hypothetical protein EOL95_09710 [Bacteroidia bacterium]|nr:hypothetical protein [Bacteroidia bacterium]